MTVRGFRLKEDYPFIGFLAVAAFLIWSGVKLVGDAQHVDDTGCLLLAASALPDLRLLFFAAFALVLGRVIGRLPQVGDWRLPGGEKPADLAGTGALALLFLGATVALVYEAVGVQQSSLTGDARVTGLEPITSYVRCAVVFDKGTPDGIGGWTKLVLLLTCGLVGHWFWPWRSAEQTARLAERERSVVPAVETPGSPGIAVAVRFVTALLAWTALALAVYVLISAFDARGWLLPAAKSAVLGTYRVGIGIVVGTIFICLTVLALLEAWFAWKRWRPISSRVQSWAERNPWFVAALMLGLGAFVTHILANSGTPEEPCPPSTAATASAEQPCLGIEPSARP
jgi:hypothetical protein